MDVEALIAVARQRSDDATEPYLASDADHIRWAAEAEREAAIRSWLLYDDTSAWLSIALVAGTASYELDPRIERIDRVTLTLTAGQPRRLDITGKDAIDAECPRTGKPEMCAWVGNTLILYPTPSTGLAGTIKLAVYRQPLAPLEATADEPEIDADHHDGLVDWMLYRFYSTPDSEMRDDDLAALAEANFIRRFGPRDTADTRRRHKERRRVTTVYGGY